MAVTQGMLDALDEAIASGLLTVRNGHKIVTYQSVDAMMDARAFVARQLAIQAGANSGTPRFQLAEFRDCDP